MPVSAVTNPTTTVQSNPAGYTARAPKQVLDSEDFMKLLTTQMSHQDPLKPMEDTAFIAQMASFSSLAQMNQLTKDFSLLRTDNTRYTANSFLGAQVTMKHPDVRIGTVTGIVEAVDSSGPEPLLQVNGETFPMSYVLRVELPQPPATVVP